ncbi:endonuclease [Fulvivirga ligni]|uniref:endonuclease n=1 Tax=Fulvivirga ligni TaxID=2904246 RepID=UPI001F23C407|nr:endonuclease [Fulvivirga ligni]UII19821.1 endonuclease [Fulvivirga ligni]
MKKRSLLALLCLISTVVFGQVQNGSFESWSGSTPNGWTTIDGGISVSSNSSTVKSGSTTARVTVNTTTQSNTDFLQTISVTPGVNYNFSVWVYHTEGHVRARLYVDGYRDYSANATTGQWQQITYSYTPSTSSILVGLRFYDVSGFDGSEVVYVDDFQPTSGGGGGGGGSGCSDTEVTLSLNTDNYGSETSWELKSSSSTVLYSGNGYASNSSYSEDFCLADGSYTFIIYDAYGDGICCSYGSGSYVLSGSSSYASGGDFGSQESTSFTIGSGGGGGGGTGYYAGTSGLGGYTLKTALYDIIKTHTAQGYGALWTFYSSNELDAYYENDGTILDIYSEKPGGSDSYTFTKVSDQCGTYAVEGDCYNREHSFPRSWFGGAIEPMNSDVHHIFPTDGYVNGRRSSYPYGEVGSASYTSSNGSKLGSAVSGLGYSGTVFEPIDEFKGDVARAYFYMATRYQNVIGSWESNSSYSNAVLNGTNNQVFESWMLNMLISWHNSDPVSQKERDRNDAVHSYQGNRNPFVDHPEWVASIWGSGSPFARKASDVVENQVDMKVYYYDNTLHFKGIEPTRIIVLDVSGKVVIDQAVSQETAEIPLVLPQKGIYILQVESDQSPMSQLIMAQ